MLVNYSGVFLLTSDKFHTALLLFFACYSYSDSIQQGYIVMKMFLIQAINAMAEKLAGGNHYALGDVQAKQQQV